SWHVCSSESWGSCYIYNSPKIINELNQGNSQLIFLVPKTDCTNMREQMMWTTVSRQEMGFLEKEKANARTTVREFTMMR
ncbi:MAG: hypothetical protein WCG29_02265, partial [Desulfomonile sp.]